jgi:dTDP-4-amino-4,6-dideoxyglucose
MKRTVDDLAAFGGTPLFDRLLHVGRPSDVDRRVLAARIDGAMERHWLTNDGPLVRTLEATLSEFLGVRHCIAVSSATVGLQLVAKALGVRGEVLMPGFTFVGTATALSWIGLTPVFCDVLPESHNLDPAEIRRRATSATAAILGVHLWGRSCDVEQLEAAARELSVPLFFDSAHALGCSHRSRPLGNFGCAEVFSLHATKVVTSLEGGVVTTNDSDLAERIRQARNFGFVKEDQTVALGINGKMNEFSAAMGLTSLEAYPGVRAHNVAVHAAYRATIVHLNEISLIEPSGPEWNYHYAILQLQEPDGFWRNAQHRLLQKENVLARRYFTPGVHRSAPYAESGHVPESLPVTERLADTLLSLPTGTQLSPAEAAAIGEFIAFCYAHRSEITDRLRGTG